MNDELSYSLEKLKNAFAKLQEGVKAAKDELDKDGVIQRFEFTVELLWKSLKISLLDEKIDARTPKQTLKEAFRLNWVEDEKTFLDMLDDRNKMSHIYSQQEADVIFQRIKQNYLFAIQKVLKKLESKT